MKNTAQKKQSQTLVSGEVVDIFSLFGLSGFPYITKVSFLPLIRFWKTQLNSENQIKVMIAQDIFSQLDEQHELYQPIEKVEVLSKYPKIIDLLVATFFPIGKTNHLIRLTGPFNTLPFYHSPFINTMLSKSAAKLVLNKAPEKLEMMLVIRAGCMILNQFYNKQLPLNPSYIFTAKNAETSLERHFQTEIDDRFLEVIPKRPLKELSDQQIHQLLSDIENIDLWLEYLPPENFEIHGVLATTLVDVTSVEALSRLKNSLLKSDAIVSKAKIGKLEFYLRTFFNQPNLRLGIFLLDLHRGQQHQHRYEINHGFLAEKYPKILSKKFIGSIYEKACEQGGFTIVNDLENYPDSNRIKEALLEEGLRSLLLVPIVDEYQRVIGIMELGSPDAYALDSFSTVKLNEIIPLIRVAVNRCQLELNNQIEAIIRTRFTSLHPSVEWRFRNDAYQLLLQEKKEKAPQEFEPILFRDVYPLYGQADIVGSSLKQNQAVQADLVYNLYQIKKLLKLAQKATAFPIAEKIAREVDTHISAIKRQVTSTNEYQITAFIHKEIHPIFHFLEKKASSLKQALTAYFDQLDPMLRIVYHKRKAYDQSVTLLNKEISGYLEKEEQKAQKIFPHYFEKYQTDGVAYNIYVGQALLEKGKFKKLHLKNLRLWQLIKMCEITKMVHQLKPQMPIPLETAQLILVHSAPLTIQFRMDEKRFDVAGSYNVRYEIIKKRIDKAVIEGTNERLTVSGKVAIVYQHEKDRKEYLEYLNFLIQKGLITKDIEELPLRRLQGVQGLKALRMTVNL